MDIGQKINLSIAIATGVYVICTVVLVVMTGRSLKLTREQSEKALATSDRQSKETIAAVREQIATSEKQAQEALYSQHKPVIVPIDTIATMGDVQSQLRLLNKGARVALNTWGIYTWRGLESAGYFIKSYSLSPDVDSVVSFTKRSEVVYPTDTFEGYPFCPRDDEDRGIFPVQRLMVTYNDAFNNKYLVVFDYSNEFGWQQVDSVKKIEKRLDEYVVKKKVGVPTP